MLTTSYIHGNYIDEVFSMRRADGSGVIRDFYYHQDDLFNVTMVTDASGAAVERYDYGDYGAPRFFDGGGSALAASAIGNPRLFNGREWDAEVAMYYYRTRYMEPSLGRFTARDTIGVWGDRRNVGNGVIFAGSSPLVFVDPLGEGAIEDWWRETVEGDKEVKDYWCDSRDEVFKDTIRQLPGAICDEITQQCKDELTDPWNYACAPLGRFKHTGKVVKNIAKNSDELKELRRLFKTPSGKPAFHKIKMPTRKRAKDAARDAGHATPPAPSYTQKRWSALSSR